MAIMDYNKQYQLFFIFTCQTFLNSSNNNEKKNSPIYSTVQVMILLKEAESYMYKISLKRSI